MPVEMHDEQFEKLCKLYRVYYHDTHSKHLYKYIGNTNDSQLPSCPGNISISYCLHSFMTLLVVAVEKTTVLSMTVTVRIRLILLMTHILKRISL